MRFIEEIVVEEFLPTFRSMLAQELRDRGLTQNEVAGLLGISQSAVSKYAHGEVERHDAVLTDTRVLELVSRLGEGLAEGEMSRVQALIETEVLIRQLERGDLLATMHETSMPELSTHDGGFDIHDADSTLRATERTLSSVRRGLRVLEHASGFATLIPAVGSNLVECLPGATSIDEVAAVPGRILDVKGRATVPTEPEFGASGHVATVLLGARDAGIDARAALNIAYATEIIERLEREGYATAAFDPETDLSEAITEQSSVSSRAKPDDITGTRSVPVSNQNTSCSGDITEQSPVSREDDGTDILYQTGGMGIEPAVYILGPDAPTVAEIARDLTDVDQPTEP